MPNDRLHGEAPNAPALEGEHSNREARSENSAEQVASSLFFLVAPGQISVVTLDGADRGLITYTTDLTSFAPPHRESRAIFLDL